MKNLKKIFLEKKIGSMLTILSSLSFFLMCMILPLVGPAGSSVAHSSTNNIIFLNILLITIILSLSAFLSKNIQSKKFGFPKPRLSLFLMIFSLFFLIIFLVGGFSI